MLTKTTWYQSESVYWTAPAGDFTDAAGFTASAYIIGSVTQSIAGVANGDAFDFSASSGVTVLLTSGTYQVVERVVSASVVHMLSTTTITVLANPATVGSGYDARSHVKTVLDAIEAVIENRATQSDLSVTIAGRSVTKMSLSELLKARQQYKALYQQELDAESLAKGLGRRSNIRIRFTS